ncbi:MAG: toast rack family protein [Gemmatimonadota bacterium]
MRKVICLIALWGPAAAAGLLGDISVEAQTWRTMTSARQVWDTAPMEVNIRYGAGTLTVGTAESPMLYQMDIRYDEEAFTPLAEYDEDERELRLGVESIRGNRESFTMREGSTATIRLGREVPMDLDLEFGAGKAQIELGGIPLRGLELSTGASETVVSFSEPNPVDAERITIEAGAADLRVIGLGNTRASRIEFHGGVGATVLDFGGQWQGSATASVDMGIGSVTLRLPRSHGIRLDRSSFLTSFTAPGLERRGESYYSANWGETSNQLTIDVSAAFGSIEIDWID